MKKRENVKAGEEYNIRVKVIGITNNCVDVLFVDAPDIEGLHIGKQKIGILRLSTPETAPKYDPCRKFRKGDIVRLKAYNGRKPYDFWHKQTIEHFGAKLDTVLEDELDSGNVDIFQDAPIDELSVRVHASHLELVTPVEELEPYSVVRPENYQCVRIMKEKRIHSSIPFDEEECVCRTLEEAKAVAEAECARLNAEYRKEQK